MIYHNLRDAIVQEVLQDLLVPDHVIRLQIWIVVVHRRTYRVEERQRVVHFLVQDAVLVLAQIGRLIV